MPQDAKFAKSARGERNPSFVPFTPHVIYEKNDFTEVSI